MTADWLKEKKIHLMMLAGSLFIAWMFSSGAMPTPPRDTLMSEMGTTTE